MSDDRADVFSYIIGRITCGKDCKYHTFCPVMTDGIIEEDCIIRREYKTLFDAFYNLYMGNLDGLKNELTSVAFNLRRIAETPEEEMTYFNSLTKILNSCYAPEKSTKEDLITDVLINITPVQKKYKKGGE